MTKAFEAHNRIHNCVSAGVVPTRLVITVDVVGNTRCVDKDAAISPEDEAFAEGFAFLVAGHELVAELFHYDHVTIDDWQYKSEVDDAAVPLSALVLGEDRLDEVMGAIGAPAEAISLKDGRVAGFERAEGHALDDVDVALGVRVGAKLPQLALVNVDDAASGDTEASLELEFVLVGGGALKLVAQVAPVLNTAQLVVRAGAHSGVLRQVLVLII